MSGVFLSIGSGAGIGLSTARQFAAQGYRVVLAARDGGRLQELVTALKQGPNVGVEAVTLDCADPARVAAVVDHYGPELRVLHYNAAALRMQTLRDQPLASVGDDITAGLSSALVAIRQARAAMAGNGGGTILLTGGILATQPAADMLTLSVAKAGLRAAAQALFPGFAAQNIHIAVLTVGKVIHAGSPDAKGVADAFWRLHSQDRSQWQWEAVYH